MKIVRTWSQSCIVWLGVFSIIYIVSRLLNLTVLPMFTDEAIYIRWSQIGATDASWRFISLTDGKQPLFTWIMMGMLRIFKDPLFAGRITSVVSGYIGMIGMFVLGQEMFKSKRIGLIASALYLIIPFTFMYDRMALYDSLVGALYVWNMYFTVLLVRYIRLDIALLSGMAMGLGMLNKTSGFMSLYFYPVSLLLFSFARKVWKKKIVQWLGLFIVAAVLSQIIYSILRLSPYFYIVAQKNNLFVYSFAEWKTHPFQFIQGNLHGLFDWLITYLSWPVFVTAILGLIPVGKYWKERILLGIWWFGPFVGLALFGKVLYPRFILFMSLPVLILAAYSIDTLFQMIKRKILAIIIVVLILIPSIVTSYKIIFSITEAPIPLSDRGQYINDWPSGWGVKEISTILENEARTKPIAVFTEGTFGLLPYGLEVYTHDNKNIFIQGMWPVQREPTEDILKAVREKKTFLVTNHVAEVDRWPLRLISEYQKGNNPTSKMRLYEILPADKR